MNNILEVKNISVKFQQEETYILKDVSFGIQPGQTISVIGMNGTGKSTLLKIIAGVQKPTSGSIEGKNAKISYVPQKINIDPYFPIKVEEYISIFNQSTHKTKITKYLQKFEIEHLSKRNIGNLSGGELQKVLIISSLLSQPDVILLDEPTAGIDVIGEEVFYNIISELKKEFPHIAVVMVSHNIHLVYKNSDTVICLHKNNFCCHGTPSEIQENSGVQEMFGKYVAPYEHHPHSKHTHKH